MEKAYHRICIARCGYAAVPAEEKNPLQYAAEHMSEKDFEWEDVTPDLILEEGEIVETVIKNETERNGNHDA